MISYVHLNTRTVTECWEVDLDGVALQDVGALLQAAAEGLQEPYLSLSTEGCPHEAVAYVVGTRPLTDEEYRAETDRQRLAERQREYMRGMPT